MNTDELIQRLGDDLAPVTPLAPPARRAAGWLLGAAAYVGGMAALAVSRHGHAAVTAEPLYVAQQATVVVMAASAAVAAFASVVPGRNRKWLAVPLVPAAVAILLLALGCIGDLHRLGSLGVGAETDWPCVISIAVGGVALWGVAMTMLRRGAALSARTTGALAALAALGAANLEACVTRPHAFTITIVVWHGLTAIVLLAVLSSVAPRVLPWPIVGRPARR
ncbi:hypothetical protein TBR22_A18310 [Luteitalea sp. TBR-22]|uniref:NrsF family protein n=1 Tax=Luteitalea sp. TBR-22 TaxID=2802971 RepID=UPI001AFA331F|nr:NrsF family protein [Luteitalea sp. TBR-22]BCS32617.1 hypothetical protein TBR22_A18310 [Luteitalea sp. TBR-22]